MLWFWVGDDRWKLVGGGASAPACDDFSRLRDTNFGCTVALAGSDLRVKGLAVNGNGGCC